jgi:hypothetical protein
MKIDYVIISSDDNPMYYDFYPVVAKQWNKLGFEVFYAHITDVESDIEETEFGLIKKFKKIQNINSGFQSQNVRLFISTILDNKNILISDIDMLPLNKDYFLTRAYKNIDNKILVYSGQPYGNVPYYPMCYILGNTDLLKNILEIDNDYNKYMNCMVKFSNMDWNTDEKYFYNKTNNNKNVVILRDRSFSPCINRIDRGNWNYDHELLKSGYYIDSHLLRPYNKYKYDIDKLLF